MKKLSMLLFASLMAIMLAACSQTADPVEKEVEAETKEKPASAKAEKENENENKESDLTLQELFEKAVEAEDEIKSFSSDIQIKQDLSQGNDSAKMDSKVSMDYVVDPLALSQKMTYTIDAGADGKQSMEMESYLAEEGFYMFEPTEKIWLKMPVEFSDQMLNLENSQSNPADAIRQLEQFADDFTFEQNDSSYILKLTASGEKFTDFLIENVQQSLPEDMLGDLEMLEGLKFKDVLYEIHLDKETFFPSVVNVDMEMEADIEGTPMKIKQKVQSTYRDYNKIDKIEIPQEALDNAQEVSMEDLAG